MEAHLRRLLTKGLGGILGALVTGSVALAFLQVVFRYVFNAAIVWVEEISVMALIWLAWTGVVYLWLSQGHIAVDILGQAVSAANLGRLAVAIDLLALAGGIALFLVSRETLEIFSGMSLGSLEIDASYKYWPIAAGGLGLALAAVLNLWRRMSSGESAR